ncbi:P-loop containing nucleoside triphosphate hydrolase protein, partial [Mycena amicta]
LPSKPKIFCGRDTELDQILRAFTSSSPSPSHPRIAILGPGGIGKTSLAKAVLHDPDIAGRYDKQRYFVTCDAANTRGGIAEMVASNLGLKPSKDATRPVVRHLKAMTSPCFLVLDNLETAWERQEERAEVEEFLALLAEVESVALLITMRGAERPAGVQWSRPFLPPLAPLSQTAARQMFVDIADHTEEDQDLEDVLRLTDNLPLAITLLAHLVDSEGCATVLARWENEKTLLVSDGYDRNSNLNLSIQLSLSSPRIALLPQCAELLGLLALSPDGVSDVELQLMNLPIHDVLRCKTALLRTALAYNTEQNRLKVLVPIQEYILRFEPPGRALVRAALRHYLNLLELDKMYEGTTSSPAIVQRLQANLHNMQRIVVNELAIADAGEDVELGTLVQTILELNNFSQVLLNIQQIPLMLRIPDLLERVGHDPRLEVMYITEQLNSQPHVPTEKSQAEALIKRGREHVESGRLQDKEQQCEFFSPNFGHAHRT